MPVTSRKRKAASINNAEISEPIPEPEPIPERVPFDESSLPDFTCPRALAAFIENSRDILGNINTTDSIDKLTYTDRKYDAQKLRAINRFYLIISAHPTLRNLSELVLDTEHESGKKLVPRMIVLCRGLKSNAKKRILNTCLLLVAQHLRKQKSTNLDWSSFLTDNSLFSTAHAQECYQPNVTALYHRHLFKYFHDEGVMYSMSTDFNQTGGFQAYWKEIFALCKSKRPADFGEKPLKACFDIDADYKIRNTADPPFTPFELTKKGYEDAMILFSHYMSVIWCLRGATEVS